MLRTYVWAVSFFPCHCKLKNGQQGKCCASTAVQNGCCAPRGTRRYLCSAALQRSLTKGDIRVSGSTEAQYSLSWACANCPGWLMQTETTFTHRYAEGERGFSPCPVPVAASHKKGRINASPRQAGQGCACTANYSCPSPPS